MFSTSLLRYEVHGGVVEPLYLDGRHASIARDMLDRYEAHEGKRFGALEDVLDELRDASGHDERLIAGLRRAAEEWMELEVDAPAPPWKIRERVFTAAGRSRGLDPPSAFADAARRLGISPEAAREGLYADLRPERLVRFPGRLPAAAEVISRYNFRLLQGLFLQADRVRVELEDNARAMYRLAKLHGLIVEVARGPGEGLRLEVTGPLSLFAQTRKYGHALASFLPACAAASRFRLEARLVLRGRRARIEATHADRILTSHRTARRFDSSVEERFHRDFLRLGSRWRIAREGELIVRGASAFLPDFTFTLGGDPATRVSLEIVGFWTRDYLARKRSLAEALRGERVIFCVDERLACSRDPMPFPCITFSRRVPAERVLEALDRLADAHARPPS